MMYTLLQEVIAGVEAAENNRERELGEFWARLNGFKERVLGLVFDRRPTVFLHKDAYQRLIGEEDMRKKSRISLEYAVIVPGIHPQSMMFLTVQLADGYWDGRSIRMFEEEQALLYAPKRRVLRRSAELLQVRPPVQIETPPLIAPAQEAAPAASYAAISFSARSTTTAQEPSSAEVKPKHETRNLESILA